MAYLIIGLGAFFLSFWLLRVFARANPARLAAQFKTAGGIALLLLAGFLAVTGRWAIALPIGGFALTFLGLRRVPGFRNIGSGARPADTEPGPGAASGSPWSYVRVHDIEMALHRETGALEGRVRTGRFSGRTLDELSQGELGELYAQIASDPDGVALLETYLDRRIPGWREHFDTHTSDRQAGPARPRDNGVMSEQEAYDILGLAPGASAREVAAAHRRLMKLVHPDRGGSAFLAAKLNQAKDILFK